MFFFYVVRLNHNPTARQVGIQVDVTILEVLGAFCTRQIKGHHSPSAEAPVLLVGVTQDLVQLQSTRHTRRGAARSDPRPLPACGALSTPTIVNGIEVTGGHARSGWLFRPEYSEVVVICEWTTLPKFGVVVATGRAGQRARARDDDWRALQKPKWLAKVTKRRCTYQWAAGQRMVATGDFWVLPSRTYGHD